MQTSSSHDSPSGANYVVPGSRLGEESAYTAGPGTYALNGFIYASVVGVKEIVFQQDCDLLLLRVARDKPELVLPDVNDLVTARVTRINARMAFLEILTVGPTLLNQSVTGTIRLRDVRRYDVDDVDIYSSFRPGDIVKAQVISLGDRRSYFLSTAKNDLGVILATSPAGHIMVPLNWTKMKCPVTNAIESRKVAEVKQLKR